ncbi:3-oxoacyl-[acyl-carrier protein] reductase [Fibrobacter sp. UWH4]|nr:3-oxoacyl-[acyl-carrier protein] reductase [Fibrobacter sp. UWH4]
MIKKIILKLVTLFKHKRYIPIVSITSKEKMLEGKKALVVGGSGGIGSAIAKKLKECGCYVIITGSNESKLKNVAKDCNADGFVTLNLKDISSFDDKINEVENKYGKIDILVCSSGIHVKRKGFNYMSVSTDEFDDIMNVNMRGVYFICQKIAKRMVELKKNGNILIISSSRGAEPSWSPYSLSKRCLNGYIEGLAKELVPYGIVVNGIAPGPTATTMQDELVGGSIYTNQNPLERLTMPEEVAEYACMLVSSLGNTVAGQTIFLSGGRGIFDIR